MTETYLSLVIPAYNESERLPGTLDAVAECLGGMDFGWEIIVVDDGSDDGTAGIARDMLESKQARHKVIELGGNKGKGAAVKAGREF